MNKHQNQRNEGRMKRQKLTAEQAADLRKYEDYSEDEIARAYVDSSGYLSFYPPQPEAYRARPSASIGRMNKKKRNEENMGNQEFTTEQADGLRQLYRDDKLARVLFDAHSSRRVSKRHLTTEHLLELAQAPSRSQWHRSKALKLFKSLEKLGLAKVTLGRRSKGTRVQFFKTPKELAKVARSAGSSGKAAKKPPTKKAPVTPFPKLPPTSTDVYCHSFQIRPEATASMLLPSDLRGTEVERLDLYLRALPMALPIQSSSKVTKLIRHEFPLRPELPVLLELPVDLTMREARQLTNVITGLAS